MWSCLWFVGLAHAGTLVLESSTPVSFRVDGDWVGRLVLSVTVTDLPDGPHVVDVCDAFGQVIGTHDVVLTPHAPVALRFDDQYLNPVAPVVEVDPGLERPVLSAAEFLAVERSLVKSSDKARTKQLEAAAARYWFEMRHVDALLPAFETLDARVAAAVLLAGKTVDPQKFAAIEDHFPPGDNRERVRAAFASP